MINSVWAWERCRTVFAQPTKTTNMAADAARRSIIIKERGKVMSKFINGKKYEGAIMVNDDGVWAGDINGVWQTAVPLPFYRSWIFIKRYQCECGQKFHSERHYELHYYHDHTNRKIYNRTPKGLVEINPTKPLKKGEK